MASRNQGITSFALAPGRVIGGKYIVEGLLGAGWEGEVYRVVDRRTEAARAAKLFFPQRNQNDRAVRFYSRKLEALRACPIVISYIHTETLRFRGETISVLISDLIDGEVLEDFIARRRGKRLPEYEALRIFYDLATGLEQIHAEREYHGDLHAGNVLVHRRGVHFDVHLVDLFDLGRPSRSHAQRDVTLLIRLLYDMLGGQKHYAQQRPAIKHIICGLKQSLMLRKFPTAGHLRRHLDHFDWS
ncbi:MAG: protein kinase [Phycisphaerales bacterium JB038]